MNKNQIAKKFSRAIINSIDISEVEKVIEELNLFSELIDRDRQLKLLFAGQIFSENEKEQAFDSIAPLLKFNPVTVKFLKLMIVQGNLSAIREVSAATAVISNEKQKKAAAVVVSSVALDSSGTERLQNALKNMTDREVTVENQIDEGLLGGFIVRVGSTIFDSSVKGQLRLLKAELMR